MKVENVSKKEFVPVTIQITFQTRRELEAFRDFVGCSSAEEKADFVNEGHRPSNKYTCEDFKYHNIYDVVYNA